MMKKVLFNNLVFFILFFLPVHGLYAGDEADEYINGMTLPEKIGQIMLIGIQGKTLSSTDINHLKKLNPGGIVLYKRNFKDASDIPSLITNMKSIFQNNKLPLFFAIDQEGGIVHRIEGEYHKPPSAPAIGAVNSDELAREIGLSVGTTLHDMGININFAPVLDVPDRLRSSPMTRRSFSNDPRTVARLGTAYITGLHDAGILATAKHFPGVGRTHIDTHHTLPHITWKTKKEIDSDIMPFQAAIKTGVDMIMVGHFIAEPGDSKHPISLSSYWMTDVLKKEMGFQGLILVDNIEMKPIARSMPIGEAAVRSFNAGADIIMVSHERKHQEQVYKSLVDAVTNGDISSQRLNDSLKRIITAKKKILSSNTRPPSRSMKELSRLVAEESVMFLSSKDAPFHTMSADDKVLFIGYETTIYNAIKKTFPNAEILNTTLLNYKKLHPETPIEDFLRNFDALIIDANYTNASRIIARCNDSNQNYVVLETRISNIQSTLNTLHPTRLIIIFEKSREHLQVALEILHGLRKAKGRLGYKEKLPNSYKYLD
jgi:beta-N-acetylhexosaminidase